MFNTYISGPSNDVIRFASARIARSNDNLAKKIEDASKEDVKARDRVDIQLSEYERMKTKIDLLENENRKFRALYEHIGVPPEAVLNVIPGTVQVYNTLKVDYMNEAQTFRVEFDIPRECLK